MGPAKLGDAAEVVCWQDRQVSEWTARLPQSRSQQLRQVIA